MKTKVVTSAVLAAVFTLLLAALAFARGRESGNTYMYSVDRTGFTQDSTINRRSAAALDVRWTFNPPGPHDHFDSIFSQPIVSQGRIYFGSWDGYEYALNRSGRTIWKTYLGRTVVYDAPTGCVPPEAGVSSTPTIATVNVDGAPQQVMYVGGGEPYLYALDAGTGDVLWRTQLGDIGEAYLWDSPAVWNGSVYIGIPSFGDCPEIQGQVFKLDAVTGEIQATFDVVPDTCRGGAIWASPAIDPEAGMVYLATGNPNTTGPVTEPCDEPDYSLSFVKLRAGDLSYVGSWQIPPEMRVFDSDFGATPTLFTDSSGRKLVGAENKDGYFYALDRDNITAGPVWRTRVSVGGACPQCGQAAISPAAFDGQTLFAAAGITEIDGETCGGNVRALDPATGAILWETCFQAPGADFPPAVLGAVTATPQVLIVGSGQNVVVLDKETGDVLREVTVTGDVNMPPPYFWGAPTVADGMIYAGNMSGTFVAIGYGN